MNVETIEPEEPRSAEPQAPTPPAPRSFRGQGLGSRIRVTSLERKHR